VHNFFTVQVAKGKDNLSWNELDRWLFESLHLVQVVIDITTRYVLKEEVNPELVLKYVVHWINEGMICIKQDLLLNLDVLYLVLL